MKILLAALFTASLATAAVAQSSETLFVPNLQGQTVQCSAFRHEADGSWTALKTVPVQRQNEFAELYTGTNVRPGSPPVVGIDVAGTLSAFCPA